MNTGNDGVRENGIALLAIPKLCIGMGHEGDALIKLADVVAAEGATVGIETVNWPMEYPYKRRYRQHWLTTVNICFVCFRLKKGICWSEPLMITARFGKIHAWNCLLPMPTGGIIIISRPMLPVSPWLPGESAALNACISHRIRCGV